MGIKGQSRPSSPARNELPKSRAIGRLNLVEVVENLAAVGACPGPARTASPVEPQRMRSPWRLTAPGSGGAGGTIDKRTPTGQKRSDLFRAALDRRKLRRPGATPAMEEPSEANHLRL
jgi:hypothetical protein